MPSQLHEALLLLQGTPVLGIVVEVQLGSDPDKRYVWPVYVANLRARIRCGEAAAMMIVPRR